MEIINFNELSLIDSLSHTDTPILFWAVTTIGLIATVTILIFAIKELSDGPSSEGIQYAMSAAIMILVIIAGTIIASDSGIRNIKENNIAAVYEIPEDTEFSENEDLLSAQLRDDKDRVLRDVTFGFEDNGNPFIYETETVTKEFIEGIRK